MNRKLILTLICLLLPSYKILAHTYNVYERNLIDANLFNGQHMEVPREMQGIDNSVVFSQLYQSVSFQEVLNLGELPENTFMDITLEGVIQNTAGRQLTLQLLSSGQSAEDIIVPITCDTSSNQCVGSLEITQKIAQVAVEYDRLNIASDADIVGAPVDIKTITLGYQIEDEYKVYINPANQNIVASMPTENFNKSELIRIEVNGKYRASTYNGKSYYSSNKSNGNVTEVSKSSPIRVGDVITMYKAKGKPGAPGHNIEELTSYTITDADINNEISADFYEIEASKTKGSILIAMSKELFESKDKIVFYSQNKYLASTYDGVAYYSYPTIEGDEVTIRINTNTEMAHQLKVVFSQGTPGQNTVEVVSRRIPLQ